MVKQGGVVARRQLIARGMSEPAIDRARRGELLHDVHLRFGVYSVVPIPLLGSDARLIAASLAMRRLAITSHGTAAFRWKLIDREPAVIELSTRLELESPAGVRLHRTVLRPGDVVRNGRFRMTTVERTLLDLAATYHLDRLLKALAEAEYEHRKRPEDFMLVLRRGHPGSAKLRAALDRHVPGYGRMRSRLERRFRKLLVDHRIPLPERNQPIGRWTVDCFWRDLRLVVELDGGQHKLPHQAAVDAERDLWLRRHRYIVRHYSWEQVVAKHSQDVIDDLHDAFAEARRALVL